MFQGWWPGTASLPPGQGPTRNTVGTYPQRCPDKNATPAAIFNVSIMFLHITGACDVVAACCLLASHTRRAPLYGRAVNRPALALPRDTFTKVRSGRA